MKNYKLEPDAIIYSAILKGCADSSKFQEGVSIHKQVEKYNYATSVNIQMALLYFYGKNGDVTTCYEIFNKMKERKELTLSVYTSYIHALISNKKLEEALAIFYGMSEEPDSILLSILLKGCAENSQYEEGKKIYELINPEIIDTTLAGALVYFYCKFETSTAFKLFQSFKHSGKSNTFMWNSIIQLHISNNRLEDAFDCFHQFSEFEVAPDNITFTTLLQACAENHDIVKGKFIHNYINEKNLYGDVILDRCLINFYSKCAELEMAKSIFKSIIHNKKEVNSYTFNAIILACAEHGEANHCFNYFSQMIKHEIKPTPETFTALLTACSHSHMHEKALDIYNSMKKVFGIEPSNIHTSCLIDALSRSGKLSQALEIIGDSKEKIYWMTLMGACRKFNNIEIAEKVFDTLMDIDPTDGSHYVLLSNIYTFNNEMEKATNIRELMKQNNASKVVGITSIYIGDQIHTFTSNDKKHPENELIQAELEKLINELIEAGYSPDTRWVTRTEILSTEEKLKLLCGHSEKIAMAYAFVRMPKTPKIVLFNNLRVCGDCHEASKFISKVRGCEIIVRDASRYHHMKDGKCSCGDNW